MSEFGSVVKVGGVTSSAGAPNEDMSRNFMGGFEKGGDWALKRFDLENERERLARSKADNSLKMLEALSKANDEIHSSFSRAALLENGPVKKAAIQSAVEKWQLWNPGKEISPETIAMFTDKNYQEKLASMYEEMKKPQGIQGSLLRMAFNNAMSKNDFDSYFEPFKEMAVNVRSQNQLDAEQAKLKSAQEFETMKQERGFAHENKMAQDKAQLEKELRNQQENFERWKTTYITNVEKEKIAFEKAGKTFDMENKLRNDYEKETDSFNKVMEATNVFYANKKGLQNGDEAARMAITKQLAKLTDIQTGVRDREYEIASYLGYSKFDQFNDWLRKMADGKIAITEKQITQIERVFQAYAYATAKDASQKKAGISDVANRYGLGDKTLFGTRPNPDTYATTSVLNNVEFLRNFAPREKTQVYDMTSDVNEASGSGSAAKAEAKNNLANKLASQKKYNPNAPVEIKPVKKPTVQSQNPQQQEQTQESKPSGSYIPKDKMVDMRSYLSAQKNRVIKAKQAGADLNKIQSEIEAELAKKNGVKVFKLNEMQKQSLGF